MGRKAVDRTIPPDVPKHLLFRGLLRRPRPQQQLKFRVPCAAHIRLFVRALKSVEYAEVFEAADAVEVEQLSTSAITSELIAVSVYTPKGRAFMSGAEVLRLRGEEMAMLGIEVLDALHRVSPTFQRSETAAWRMALKEGAQHPSNFNDALTMYRSCDRVAMSNAVWERPDRYFGLPYCELTDGHQLAYSAAVELVSSLIRSKDG